MRMDGGKRGRENAGKRGKETKQRTGKRTEDSLLNYYYHYSRSNIKKRRKIIIKSTLVAKGSKLRTREGPGGEKNFSDQKLIDRFPTTTSPSKLPKKPRGGEKEEIGSAKRT